MTAEVRAFQVLPGTLIELHDIEFYDEDARQMVVQEIERAAGHDQFVVLHTYGDGMVNILTPESALTLIREALTQEGTHDGNED